MASAQTTSSAQAETQATVVSRGDVGDDDELESEEDMDGPGPIVSRPTSMISFEVSVVVADVMSDS